MTKFLDGPAVDVVLGLRRAPLLLRVVQDRLGNWDALDQLEDEPKHGETVSVYVRVAGPWKARINRGRRAGGCVWLEGGEYRHLEPQPAVEILRRNGAWRDWASRDGRPLAERFVARCGGDRGVAGREESRS